MKLERTPMLCAARCIGLPILAARSRPRQYIIGVVESAPVTNCRPNRICCTRPPQNNQSGLGSNCRRIISHQTLKLTL